MNKRDSLLLACLKRCERFLQDLPNLLGTIRLSPPARELYSTIEVIEYCAAARQAGDPQVLSLVVRHGRNVRRGLDDLVRPIVRENRALANEWKRVKRIETRG